MKALRNFALLAAAALIFCFPASATFLIDDFTTDPFIDCVGTHPTFCADPSDFFDQAADPAHVLGGNRRVTATYVGDGIEVGFVDYGVDTFSAFKFIDSSLHGSATINFQYNAAGAGLGGIDLTEGGANTGLVLIYGADHATSIGFCLNGADASCTGGSLSPLVALPATGGAFAVIFVPFWTAATSVDSIGFEVNGTPNLDFQLALIVADNVIPEPGSMLLAGLGLIAVAAYRRRR